MASQQWILVGSKQRQRRQIRMRTNAAGRLKQERIRKLRVQRLLKESSSSSAAAAAAASAAAAAAGM
ncbi:hypothetical protein LOAG_05852 [Loa loa]|uniref:BZIP domain-containing protein n=1 Tax=Loa loa TaxID=7209 RepID=A0A1I7W4D6_LOALO|nr:hypothetical protein LOAG_05852 [Loa loa]EFO22636.1 hypothetical protein LOAG_05852 [Loa loa]